MKVIGYIGCIATSVMVLLEICQGIPFTEPLYIIAGVLSLINLIFAKGENKTPACDIVGIVLAILGIIF